MALAREDVELLAEPGQASASFSGPEYGRVDPLDGDRQASPCRCVDVGGGAAADLLVDIDLKG